MADRLRWKSWVTGALVLAAAAGCAGSDAGTPTSRPTSAALTSPTPVASSPSPLSPSEAAAAPATSLLRHYFEVLDAVRADPRTPISELNEVAVGSELAIESRLVRSERRQRLHQVGTTRLVQLTVQSVSLDNSDPKAGRVPSIEVDVCWDVSSVDILGADGTSIVSPSRPDRGWTRFIVANYHWTTHPSDGWRVASGQDLKKDPCPAA